MDREYLIRTYNKVINNQSRQSKTLTTVVKNEFKKTLITITTIKTLILIKIKERILKRIKSRKFVFSKNCFLQWRMPLQQTATKVI